MGGVHASGVAPIKLSLLTKLTGSYYWGHPKGGDLDFTKLQICGDDVCLKDPTEGTDPLWEWLRRTPPIGLGSASAIPATDDPANKLLPIIERPSTETKVFPVLERTEAGSQPLGAEIKNAGVLIKYEPVHFF